MNVQKVRYGGFTQIFTSDHPAALLFDVPKKTPYIVFTLSDTEENVNYIRRNRVSRLGTVDFEQNQYLVRVTGARKVMQAIDIFLKEPSIYPPRLNKALFEHLIAYQEICRVKLEQKQKKSAPLKSKSYTAFLKTSEGTQPETSNITHLVVKNKNLQKKYIYKENSSGRSISELETFNGFSYRLLLGLRHPKVKPVHHPQGERAGLVSKKFTQFQSLRDIENRTGNFPTKEQLLNAEVAKIWVASYVEEENDLHGDNYGIGSGGFCVKIDDDQATWPLTSKYAEVDPQKGQTGFNHSVAPIKAFPVTERDILNFPKLKDAKPRNWPDKSEGSKIDFSYFSKQPKFINDKYYTFLKRILIQREEYEAIGLATISSDKTRKKFVDHKCNKTEELKKVLLNIREFQNYVINHPGVIEQIKTEFKDYNQDYKKLEDNYLRVNLEEIEKNFNRINREIYTKQRLPIPEKFQGHKKPTLIKVDPALIGNGDKSQELDPPLTNRRKQKTSFFKRHPWTRDVLIGIGIGLAIVGTVAIIAITVGGALPLVVGVGTAVGTIFGLSGTLATGIGLGVIGTGCVAASSVITRGVGAIIRTFSGKQIDRVRDNNSTKEENPIIVDKSDLNRGWSKPLEKGESRAKEQGSCFNSSLVEQLKRQRPSKTCMFFQNKELTQQDIDDINKIISFLKKNIEFFVEPFLDQNSQKEFAEWVLRSDKAQKLAFGLKRALRLNGEDNPPSLQYQEAFLGEGGKKDGLKDGNDRRIKKLLIKNSMLRSILKENLDNPAINAWYRDTNTSFKCRYSDLI